MTVILITSLSQTDGAYVLEGSIGGRWDDSGVNYNKQVN